MRLLPSGGISLSSREVDVLRRPGPSTWRTSAEALRLPPGQTSVAGQALAFLGRLYLQGDFDLAAMPVYGGFTDFHFELLERTVARGDAANGFVETSSADGRALLVWLRRYGIPTHRAFALMLHLYRRELSAFQLKDGYLEIKGADDARTTAAAAHDFMQMPPLSPSWQGEAAVIQEAIEVGVSAMAAGMTTPAEYGQRLLVLRDLLDQSLATLDKLSREQYQLEIVPGRGRRRKPFGRRDETDLHSYWLAKAHNYSIPRLREHGWPGEGRSDTYVSKEISRTLDFLRRRGETARSQAFDAYGLIMDMESHWFALTGEELPPRASQQLNI